MRPKAPATQAHSKPPSEAQLKEERRHALKYLQEQHQGGTLHTQTGDSSYSGKDYKESLMEKAGEGKTDAEFAKSLASARYPRRFREAQGKIASQAEMLAGRYFQEEAKAKAKAKGDQLAPIDFETSRIRDTSRPFGQGIQQDTIRHMHRHIRMPGLIDGIIAEPAELKKRLEAVQAGGANQRLNELAGKLNDETGKREGGAIAELIGKRADSAGDSLPTQYCTPKLDAQGNPEKDTEADKRTANRLLYLKLLQREDLLTEGASSQSQASYASFSRDYYSHNELVGAGIMPKDNRERLPEAEIEAAKKQLAQVEAEAGPWLADQVSEARKLISLQREQKELEKLMDKTGAEARKIQEEIEKLVTSHEYTKLDAITKEVEHLEQRSGHTATQPFTLPAKLLALNAIANSPLQETKGELTKQHPKLNALVSKINRELATIPGITAGLRANPNSKTCQEELARREANIRELVDELTRACAGKHARFDKLDPQWLANVGAQLGDHHDRSYAEWARDPFNKDKIQAASSSEMEDYMSSAGVQSTDTGVAFTVINDKGESLTPSKKDWMDAFKQYNKQYPGTVTEKPHLFGAWTGKSTYHFQHGHREKFYDLLRQSTKANHTLSSQSSPTHVGATTQQPQQQQQQQQTAVSATPYPSASQTSATSGTPGSANQSGPSTPASPSP